MELMEALLTRRSVRHYTEEPVTEEQIEKLLHAAMAAPSAGNERPWHFVVLTERRLIDAIPEFHPYSKMLLHAPAALVVIGDESLEKYKGFWVQDCAATTQNILLAARDQGLGSCWLGLYPLEDRVKAMRKLLGLGDHLIPFCVVALGHPTETPREADRYDASRVHYNGWAG